MPSIHLLSGGAAKGLVSALQERFLAQTGFQIEGQFNAVGFMRDQLLAGTACDVVILTYALIRQLVLDGQAVAGSDRALGLVKTGIAVKEGATSPALDSPEQLKQALLAATSIHFPDPVKATAGIHFMKVLHALGVDTALASRLRPHANGAVAMHALAQDGTGAIGCTQVTEIIFAPGVHLAGALPKEFELATVYSAAVCSRALQPQAATALIELLVSHEASGLRRQGGFEPAPD